MTRWSNLENWIQIAKVAAAAGEMAPFPYIKGIGGCAALILEAIQKAGKNDEDLLDLAESIGETINLILDAVEEHGKSSALHFRDVCTEFEKYMTYLRDEVNSTRLESRGRFRQFKRFLKRNEVCDAVNGYRKRVHAIKEKFMIRMAINSRFIISDINDGLRTNTDAITSAIEMSQRHTMSNIDNHADSIYKGIHTWGVSLSADVQTLKERSSYKGYVRNVLPGDIYLRDCLDNPDDKAVFTRYNADVGNAPKIVHVYRRSSHSKLSEQYVMRQFHKDVDRQIKLKHPCIAQVFGVCRSPDFTAIILHGTTRISVFDHYESLTATQSLHFNIQLFNDLESTSDYLSRFYHTSRQGWADGAFDDDPSDMYINEGGRIVLAELSSSYTLNAFYVNISRHREARPAVALIRHGLTPDIRHANLIRGWNSLMRRTSFDKRHLIEIYDALYDLLGYKNDWRSYPSRTQGTYSLGSLLTPTGSSMFPVAVIGKIPVEPMEWEIGWNSRTTPFPTCSGSFTIHNLSVIQEHSVTITPHGLQTSEYYAKRLQMMYSWFAQASRLSSSSSQNIRGIDRMMYDMKYVGVCENMTLGLLITPHYASFQLLDTFMADSEDTFALSLTIYEPHFDSQSNAVPWPVIRWFCDSSLSNEISVEEVEALFGIRVSWITHVGEHTIPKKAFSTIVEINTMCGFDPALEGADICEYFGLSRLEIFENPVELSSGYEIDRIALPVTVRDHKDAADVTPVTRIRAEKEPSASRTSQNRLIPVLVALIIALLSLVIRLSMKV